METESPLHTRNWSRAGVRDLHFISPHSTELFYHMLCRRKGLSFARSRKRTQYRPAERRISVCLSILQLLLPKTSDIMMPRELNRWMKRSVRLYKHLPSHLSPSCPTRYLNQKLKNALRSTKVGQIQSPVDSHNSHASHFGKMKPLRNHLGSDQNICSSLSKVSQSNRMSPPDFHTV